MGRYSPTVLPDYGPTLGSHLLQAAQTFMAMKDHKRQQQREDVADRQHAQLFDRQMQGLDSEATQRNLQLQQTPGVTTEPVGVRDALNTAANFAPMVGGTVGAAPGGGTAPGVSIGHVNGQDVRYDSTQSPANLARAQQFKKIAEWQTVTNPSTGKPFTQGEAYLLGMGSAKYTDFKPPRPYRANQPHYIQDPKLGWVQVDPTTGRALPVTANGQPVMGMPRATPGGLMADSPEVAATRRDLAGIGHQQVRAETSVKALKSERRQLLTDHPRANKPLTSQRTAADSTLANRYGQLGTEIDSASARSGRLTQKADSVSSVLERQRATGLTGERVHGPNAGGDEAPFDAQAFDDSISEEELHDALANGAQDEESVRAHVLALRGGQ